MEQVARWGLARVRGESMLPTLRPGDRVLVDHRRRPRPGDVVAARFPDGTLAVKRVDSARTDRLGGPAWWLLSDNPVDGIDSRHRGAVADAAVLGVDPVDGVDSRHRGAVADAAVLGVVRLRVWPWPGRVPPRPAV